MAKVAPRRRRRRDGGGTNWYIIGGIAAVGVIGLFALLFITLQGQGMPTPTPEPDLALIDYCNRNPDRCIEKGEADAPVTVVEVSDYGCSHCRNFNVGGTAESLDSLYVDTGQVRWIILPYALGNHSAPTAVASMCAAEQDAFWSFHESMFELQTTDIALSEEAFIQSADALDLDMEAFRECLSENRYAPTVQSNIAAARRAGVSATPTFFINGEMVEGNQPLSNFQRIIDSALGTG